MANFPSTLQEQSRWAPGRAGLAILPLLAILGCGGSSGSGTVVTGKILYRGDPVSATMKFIGADKEYLAAINADGTYAIVDLPVGEYSITLAGIKGEGNLVALPKDKLPEMPGGKTGAAPGKTVQPPPKYATVDGGLKYAVKSGKQVHNIDLE